MISHFDGQQAELVVCDGAPDGALPWPGGGVVGWGLTRPRTRAGSACSLTMRAGL